MISHRPSEPHCIDCAAPIPPGAPALCVATPQVHGCLCPSCAGRYATREAALERLWQMVRRNDELA